MLDEKYSLLLNESPCFVKNQAKELLTYIESHIRYADDGESLSVLEHGKLEPSPILVSSINKIIHEDASLALVDTQKVAFEKIKALVEACKIDGRKRTILVNGGPGSGKTLIAAHLLGHFLKKGYSCVYSTKNRDLRRILGDELGGNPSLGNIIKYPRTLLDMDEDSLDLALVDESQRLSLYDERRHKFGPVQVEQIIKSSKVSVFFIDDKQIVTSSDATTKSLIYESSKNAGAIFHDGESFTLTTQFRCIGADNYMPFIEYFIYGDKNSLSLISDESDSSFDFKVFDYLSAMSEALRKKRKEGNSARMVAGFCYKWKSKKDDSVFDIEIGDFKAKWNKLRKNATDGVPWALDDAQAERVGCIHTCQGLEFNYVGVIIGKDMFFKNGKVQTDFRQHPSDDNAFKGLKTVNNNEELADRLIRNTYRVLLTKGQKGCYVYCEDKELAKYINNLSKKFKIKSY